MTQRIEAFDGFDVILAKCDGLGKMFFNLAQSMSGEEKVTLARKLLRACIIDEEDERAVVILHLLERAYQAFYEGTERGTQAQHFRRELEEIFWDLPHRSSGPGGGPRTVLVAVRLYIVHRLITEWRATPAEGSVYAFRRLIAMGWPEQERQGQRPGESDVEMRARGRTVFAEERKSICDIVRTHMDSFGAYEELQKGPDAVFAPWLAQPYVPNDILKILVMARAKAGGLALTIRDIRNAAVFEGLPDAALERVQEVIGPVLQMMADCEEVRQQLVEKIHEDNPYWREDLAPLEWKVTFPNIGHVEIRIGPGGDPHKRMADLRVIIKKMRKAGRLECSLTVIVGEVATATWMRH